MEDVQDFYAENHKMPRKKNIENLNKWEYTPYSLIGSVYIVFFPQNGLVMQCDYNQNHGRNSCWWTDGQIFMERQRNQDSQKHFEEEKVKFKDSLWPDFKVHHKATIIKIRLYWLE